MNGLIALLKKFLPRQLVSALLPLYHRAFPLLGALRYGFPSRRIRVIAVTGTKGKSSVCEMVAAILEASGKNVALSSTIHFRINGAEERNLYKMTMPGRFFLQSFLRRAVDAGCQYAVIEMTSEGARLWRHAWIELDALIFTNLTPEHIESHGSFENYRAMKLRLRNALERSPKKNKVVIANLDDPNGHLFLAVKSAQQIGYHLEDVAPFTSTDTGTSFTFEGHAITSPLKGTFNISNMLASLLVARYEGITTETAASALHALSSIRGRVEHVDGGQDFLVVVDYAHTKESLEALYRAFEGHRKVCVLGNTGGGRDTWKRPQMGAIAEQYCDEIILTNEDPYDEDPQKIIDAMKGGMKAKEPLIVMDRREAIRTALSHAKKGDAILITGKGTDPYIMGANGTKTPWDDATVAREELQQLRGA